MNRMLRLGLTFILCGIPTLALAQTTGGTIAGLVLDESNAGVPGATVTIRETDTDARRVLVTDEHGRYSAPALEPGTYEITAWHEKLGTRTASITVGANDKKTQDFKFAVPTK